MKSGSSKNNASISSQSAEHFIANDDSLAQLLLNHNIKVRDFVLLSFLSDQGPMSVARLASIVGLEPDKTLQGLKRLSAANLVMREPGAAGNEFMSIARLTGRGEDIAGRIGAQLD